MTNRYWMVFFSAWHWVGVCVFSIARAWSDYDVVGAHRVWGLGVLDLGAFPRESSRVSWMIVIIASLLCIDGRNFRLVRKAQPTG